MSPAGGICDIDHSLSSEVHKGLLNTFSVATMPAMQCNCQDFGLTQPIPVSEDDSLAYYFE